MEKKTTGLVCALAGLASMGAAQAAPHPVQPAERPTPAASYAALLTPIPNALEVLKASDEALAKAPAPRQAEQVQFFPGGPPPGYHHHHHHHHHAYYPPPHHHHHHHHHGGVTVVVPGIGAIRSD